MSVEELRELLKTVLDSGDDVGATSDIFNQIVETYSTTLAQVEQLQTDVTSLEEKNASLVETNGKLFLQIPFTKEEKDEEVEENKHAPLDEVMQEIIEKL